MATKEEESGATDGGYSTPDTTVQEKHDGGADPEPEYAEGFRLAAVMGTIFLSTLLAALDIVSTIDPRLPCAGPMRNGRITDVCVCARDFRASSPRQSRASRTASTAWTTSVGMEAPVSS
jgi:hypothetical protein